jgi:flagella basal body P-ring formation protein FlgA
VPAAGLLLVTVWACDAAASDDRAVEEAIVQAVRLRMGPAVAVEVSGLRVSGEIEGVRGLQASPDAGARVGGPMRFGLYVRRPGVRAARIGRAEASVTVRALHPRASRDIARGTVLSAADVEMVIDSVGRLPLKPVPPVVPGMKALRNIPQGEVLRAKMFTGMALVKAGDEVVTRVSVGGVEATGRAIAAQQGQLGRVIKVVNPDSGKRLRGRVIGEREIEVLHES